MNVKKESSILSPAAPGLVCKDDGAETNPVPCARSDGAEFHVCVLLLLFFFLYIYIFSDSGVLYNTLPAEAGR